MSYTTTFWKKKSDHSNSNSVKSGIAHDRKPQTTRCKSTAVHVRMGKLFAGALECCPARGRYGYKHSTVRTAVGADRNQIERSPALGPTCATFTDSSCTFSNYVDHNSETLTLGQPLKPLAVLRWNSIPAQETKGGKVEWHVLTFCIFLSYWILLYSH